MRYNSFTRGIDNEANRVGDYDVPRNVRALTT